MTTNTLYYLIRVCIRHAIVWQVLAHNLMIILYLIIMMTHRTSRAFLRNYITRYCAIKYPLPFPNNYAHRARCSDLDLHNDKPWPSTLYRVIHPRAHTRVFLNKYYKRV